MAPVMRLQKGFALIHPRLAATAFAAVVVVRPTRGVWLQLRGGYARSIVKFFFSRFLNEDQRSDEKPVTVDGGLGQARRMYNTRRKYTVCTQTTV